MGTNRRELVKRLKLRQVVVVPTRHASDSQEELRTEGQVEADEGQCAGPVAQLFAVHLAGELRPPVQTPMKANMVPPIIT